MRHHKTEPVIQILKTCSIEFEVLNYKAYNPISLSHYFYDRSSYEVHTIVATLQPRRKDPQTSVSKKSSLNKTRWL